MIFLMVGQTSSDVISKYRCRQIDMLHAFPVNQSTNILQYVRQFLDRVSHHKE